MRHSLVNLTTAIEMAESRWQLTVEKSLFVATSLKYAITDEEFEGGRNVVCTEFLQSMMCNEAEREIRAGNLDQKHGVLLTRRADKKREVEQEEAERPRPKTRRKNARTAAQGKAAGTPKLAEVQKSNKIDYDRFNDYLKDFDSNNNEELDFT